jgi:hypothetical protein
MKPAFDPRCRYRLLAAIISHTVWLYHVFSFIRFLFVTVYPYTGRDMSIMARYPGLCSSRIKRPFRFGCFAPTSVAQRDLLISRKRT